MPAVRVMLMLTDREEISRGLAEGLQFKEIGLRLGRDSSVVSREVGRHGGREGYRAVAAQEVARAGRERPKRFAVERSPRLRAVVCAQLRAGPSPQRSPPTSTTPRRDGHLGRFPFGTGGPGGSVDHGPLTGAFGQRPAVLPL